MKSPGLSPLSLPSGSTPKMRRDKLKNKSIKNNPAKGKINFLRSSESSLIKSISNNKISLDKDWISVNNDFWLKIT